MEALGAFSYRNQPWQTLLPVLSKLTPEQLTWRIEGNPSSIGWLVDHIASVEDFWINEVAFHAPRIAPETAPENDLVALLAKYERVRGKTEHWLDWTSERELKRVLIVPEFPDGWKPMVFEPDIRWAFQHVFSHEAYHIGQIVVLMRLQGIEDPLF